MRKRSFGNSLARVLDLNAVVGHMHKLFERVLGTNVQIVAQLNPALGRVRMDPGQVEQVLLNLAVNARDAMPRGGRLTVATANVELPASYPKLYLGGNAGPHVLLEVSDTGCGMVAHTLYHLFEPFFTTKEPGKGTGLGLATVFGIVKQHLGHIDVESVPGHGATFKIYLPRAEETAQVFAPVDTAPRSAAGLETVLLAESEDVVRRLMRTVLRRQGHTVLEAQCGEDAFALSDRHPGPVHLLLSDVVLPGMSGRDLARRVVAQRPSVKVLFVSGNADDSLAAYDVAEAPLLPKPFTQSVLLRKVREILDQ